MATLLPTAGASRGFASTDPELAAIDASVRAPVMACFLTAVHWMVVGTFLLVYACSLRHPQDSIPILGLFIDLSDHFSMFTFGRVWPAAIDALVYGWASTAGLGLAVWLLARMSRAPAQAGGVLMIAIIFWNLGIAIGLSGIFLGDSSSVELLEFPAYASWILWISYVLFALWAVAAYLGRRKRPFKRSRARDAKHISRPSRYAQREGVVPYVFDHCRRCSLLIGLLTEKRQGRSNASPKDNHIDDTPAPAGPL